MILEIPVDFVAESRCGALITFRLRHLFPGPPGIPGDVQILQVVAVDLLEHIAAPAVELMIEVVGQFVGENQCAALFDILHHGRIVRHGESLFAMGQQELTLCRIQGLEFFEGNPADSLELGKEFAGVVVHAEGEPALCVTDQRDRALRRIQARFPDRHRQNFQIEIEQRGRRPADFSDPDRFIAHSVPGHQFAQLAR